jgi:hypothetical protein
MARDPPVMAPEPLGVMAPEPPGVMVPEPPVMVVPEPPVTVPDPPPPPLAIPVIAPSTPAIEHDGEIMEKHYRRRRATRQHKCAFELSGGCCTVHDCLLAPT